MHSQNLADATSDDTGLIPYYKKMAIANHAGQMYGDKPYTYHLERVEQVLVDFGYDSETWRAAAWLHDIVEDTLINIGTIYMFFGGEVAGLVNAVTGVGANRKERNNSILTKIRMFPQAAVLKLADRIANVEEGGKVDMYRKELPVFEHVVRRYVPEAMWARLEKALA